MSAVTPATTAHGPSKKSQRVRCDAPIRVTTKYCDGRETDVQLMEIRQLEGYLLTMGCIYAVSGYYNPHAPKISYKLVNKNDILQEGELCCCRHCTKYGE